MDKIRKTLVLGLGNPILSDDAVGIRVAQELRGRLRDHPEVEVEEANVGGLRILDVIVGYHKLILIDSIKLPEGKPGDLYRLAPDDLGFTARASSPHDVNFATALEVGRRQGLPLPRQIEIYAVGVGANQTFGETLSPEVEKAVPAIVDRIVEEQFENGQ